MKLVNNRFNLKKIEETRFANIDLFYFSSFIFKKNHSFNVEGNPSKNVVIVEEELDGTDIDDFGNLEDSPRLVLIDDEYVNLTAVNDGRELTRNINQKKESDVLQ